MPLIAYKMFKPGLICRGYQFKTDTVNETEKANCRSNGFHCAENPLDCLSYYPDFTASECWEVEAAGDIDEDDMDSKISCTKMRLIRRLSLRDFMEAALLYMVRHPFRECNNVVEQDCGTASGGFAIVRGTDPTAAGKQGDLLALAKENHITKRIEEIALWEVNGGTLNADRYYDIRGKEREEREQ